MRRIWITLGLTVTVVFAGWSMIAYRASSSARAALSSSGGVKVLNERQALSFLPTVPASVGLLFFPGALVDPVAYAPLARAAAEAGFSAHIVKVPRRGAFLAANDAAMRTRVDHVLREFETPARWVLAGHSKGGVIVSLLAGDRPRRWAGLILIGTSHPRDLTLAGLQMPVTKIVGTRDGLASPREVRANQNLLPARTRWVWIDGGNHSQFGWYGFQPGDRRARIPRSVQQRLTIQAVIAALREAET